MATPSGMQEVPLSSPASASASRLATLILDTETSLDDALSLTARHFLSLSRAEAFAASLTTFAPEDETGWMHLGERAWVKEWSVPNAACSILPDPDAGPEAALSMPWMSQRARYEVVVLRDAYLLPPEAAQDRAELAACRIRSLVASTQVADGSMFGSLAMGSSEAGPWPDVHVADLRLVNSALTSRMALEQARRSLAESVTVGAQTREAQQHFFASIGHELRTPLTAIVGYTEMLVDEASERAGDPFADAVGRDGGVILRACEQLMGVVEDLLSVGRTLGTEEVGQAVDVAAAVADVLHWHRTAALTGEVRLTSTVAPGLTVWAHPAGFRQILSNLIGNAVVHNVPQGSVEVSAESLLGEAGEQRLRVIVRDTGPGLAPEELERAFDPFVRFAQPGVKGTGLGLSLSRTVAERDGGTVDAESTPGRGSAFWVELPVREADEPA